MPAKEYRAVQAMNQSGLKRLRKSPWHYHAMEAGDHPETAPTREMLQGTVAHSLLLEPDLFDEQYAVGPDISKASNAWKAFAAEAEAAGKTVIDQLMRETAYAMCDSMMSHPEVKRLWESYPGASEVSLFWEEQGVPAKARIDRLLTAIEGYIVVDVKTGSEMTDHAFINNVARLGYAHQAAWYTRAVEAVTDTDVVGYSVIACEQTYPYAVRSFYFGEAVLAQANAHIDQLLAQYRYCRDMDEWPGYPTTRTIEALPAWAFA